MADHPVDILLVSHTHWDREWYRTFEAFRARLVDTVDRVLELLAEDPGWKFVLDGQSIVVEDYLAVRPDRRAELEQRGARRAARARALVRAARLVAAGGRVAGAQPARGPAGGGVGRRVLDGRLRAGLVRSPGAVPAALRRLRARTRWSTGAATATSSTASARSTAGSRPTAAACSRTTSGAATSPPRCCRATPTTAVDGLLGVLGPPRPDRAGARAAHERHRPHAARRPHRGGGRRAGATHGTSRRARVCSTTSWTRSTRGPRRVPRRAARRPARQPPAGRVVGAARPEAAPTAAPSGRCSGGPSRGRRWARALGTPDERPSLHAAWRTLLQNHAHDSICGCSQDEVHRQMHARFARATELAEQTTGRMLERLAGLGRRAAGAAQHRARRRGVQPVAVPAHRRRAHPARRLPGVLHVGHHARTSTR